MLLATLLLAFVFVASLINILVYVPPEKLHARAWTWIKLSLFTPKSPTASSSAADTNAPSATQKLPSTKKMSAEKKAELERVFATFDKNGDGFITRQELRESLRGIRIFVSDAEVDDLVTGSDANGDGHIDLDEFCELLESVSAAASTGSEEEEGELGKRVSEGGGGRDVELKEAFDVFDKDRDGLITVEELGDVLSCLGMNEGTRVEACKEMIRKVDVDGDGMVNFDEFKRMMRGGHTLVSAH